jgi:hypothetical protein
MLVYGDHREAVDCRQSAREINRQIDAIGRMPPGLERHARLVGVLVEAGRLLQGAADADFDEVQLDRRTSGALNDSLLELGQAVCRSWDSGFRHAGTLPRLHATAEWPNEAELRVPEGFAFYGLYPEAYADAARRLKLTAPPRVIGIRSIGTSLATLVAAALRVSRFTTVRPFGDPFDRSIAIDPELERELLAGEAHFVIVDEGPGQSGSSFGAVADWLSERGVPLERIALLPSHSGAPGLEATDERRRWWNTVQRRDGDFGDRWPAMIERWCAASLGKLDEPPRDISGGAWRHVSCEREEDWPPTVPAWERRKFLVTIGGDRFVVKFAGIGRIGEEKLATARALHSEGLVPESVRLMHGFLVERWRDDAAPLGRNEKPVAEIGRYMAMRANLLPASSGSGASVDELLVMARRNVSLELGDEFESAVEQWTHRSADLERRIVRVRTDNKLDRHEWLRCASGALIKTDAVDHHRAHDLIGCQDVAWDVAGAIAEFDLDQNQSKELVHHAEFGGVRIDGQLLDFYRTAYLAFRLGHARLGAAMTADESEGHRINRAGSRYASQLQQLLENSRRAPLESSLG